MILVRDEIIGVTGASRIKGEKLIQSLWSNYGEIKKYYLEGAKYKSVIVKHIHWPNQVEHPKGWNTQTSHQRKLKSYQVEKHWYEKFAVKTTPQCRVPLSYSELEREAELLLIMEDLDASGYHVRISPENVTLNIAKNVLSWLAYFHAKFMNEPADGLWSIGTYWHLATRPDEWKKMENIHLKRVAKQIDDHLNNTTYQTLVHGDAKLANFCFSETGSVAAVDFQYVGRGCGMKDVAYFMSSCFDEHTCEKYEKELLDHYFKEMKPIVDDSVDFTSLKEEWLSLYKYAWADFYRFLDGWSSNHWKMHDYSKQLTNQVIREINRL